MGKFVVGLVIGVLIVPAAFYFYLRSGRAPVATSAPPMPLERFLVKTAMHATIRPQLPKADSPAPTDAMLTSGAQIYHQNCAGCHGLPAKAPTAVAKGMYPHPPQFFWPSPKRIDDPVGEIYWKVKNGVRLTGMPGFHISLTEEQLWQVSQFVANAPHLPASAVAALELAPQTSSPKAEPASAPRVSPKSKKALHL